jgi:hypothetical protein
VPRAVDIVISTPSKEAAMHRTNYQVAVSLLFWLPIAAGAARANPTPPAPEFRFHVHSPDPTFCETFSMDSCSDAREGSILQGEVECDLLLFDEWSAGYYRADVTFTWPPQWILQSFSLCDSVNGSFDPLPDRVEVQYESETYARSVVIGRAVLGVSGYGEVRALGTVWSVYDHREVDERGWAAVQCDYQNRPCYEANPCGATFDADSLRIVMDPGMVLADTVRASLWRPDNGCAHSMEFFVDQPWMGVENIGTLTEPVLRVAVDTSGMGSGDFLGHLFARGSDAQSCVDIHLTVTPVAARTTTWGSIRASFR